MQRWKKLVLCVSVAAVFVASVPREVQALAPPPVLVAPPTTGFCATPWGAVACFAGISIALGGELLAWWDNVEAGFVGTEDGWCMTDTGHMFQEGTAQCTEAAGPNLSDSVVQQVEDQFTGVPEVAFNPYGDYLWRLGPLQTQCVDVDGNDWCFEFARTRQVGDGIEVHIGYEPGPGACPKIEGSASGLGSGSNLGRIPRSSLDVLESSVPCYFVVGNYIGPSTNSAMENKVLVGRARESGGSMGTAQNNVEWEMGGHGNHLSFATFTGDTIIMDAPSSPVGVVRIVEYTGGIPQYDGVEVARWELARNDFEFEGEYKTITACQDGNGNVTIREATSINSFVVGKNTGTLPTAGCLPGEFPISSTIELCDVNGTACIPVAQWSGSTTLTDAEVGCFIEAGQGGEICPMHLEYWNGTSWEECGGPTEGPAPCTDWWTNPGRDILFRCGWGGDYYSASQCSALRNWYATDTPTPETDLQPVNPHDPADPTTDAPIGNPDPDTGLLPGTIIGPSTPPGARPTRTWLDTFITEWSTGTTAGLQNSCWPQGWGLLNPLQWVMRPIMCALTYLFVPTTPISVQLDLAWQEVITTTKVGLIYDSATMLTGLPAPAVGGGCGWGIPPITTPMFTIPKTDLILCPSDHGLSSQAATMRGFGYGVVGLWVAGMAYRWIGLGRSDEMPLDTENVVGNL